MSAADVGAVEAEPKFIDLIAAPDVRLAERCIGAGADVLRNLLGEAALEIADYFGGCLGDAERKAIIGGDDLIHTDVEAVIGIADIAEHRVVLADRVERHVRQRFEVEYLLADGGDQ